MVTGRPRVHGTREGRRGTSSIPRRESYRSEGKRKFGTAVPFLSGLCRPTPPCPSPLSPLVTSSFKERKGSGPVCLESLWGPGGSRLGSFDYGTQRDRLKFGSNSFYWGVWVKEGHCRFISGTPKVLHTLTHTPPTRPPIESPYPDRDSLVSCLGAGACRVAPVEI